MREYRISIIATIIAVLITSYFIYFRIVGSKASTGPFPLDWTINAPSEDTAFGGLFYSHQIDDSLPYYIYKRIEDSIKRKRQELELANKSVGTYTRFGAFGISSVKKNFVKNQRADPPNNPLLKPILDSLNNLSTIFPGSANDSIREKYAEELLWRFKVKLNAYSQEEYKDAESLYYFTLSGYDLDDNNKFFIQHDRFFLAVAKWDTVIKRTYDSTKIGHYERREIPIRYSMDGKKVLIPISKKKYNFLNSVLTISYHIWIFCMAFIFLGLPIQILIDISKGRAFTKSNIRRFKIMSLVLFIYIAVKTLLPYILKFAFRKLIPDELELNIFDGAGGITAFLFLVLAATTLLIIAKAFQKGYNLQQEQDLTI